MEEEKETRATYNTPDLSYEEMCDFADFLTGLYDEDEDIE